MQTIKSKTFCGRTFNSEEILLIQEIIGTYVSLSRKELANTVCELLEWKRSNKKMKTPECNPADEAATGSTLVITTDGKGVVMHEQDLREQTRKAAQKRKPHMETRLSKGEKKNAKRMATVAAVYTLDSFQRTPKDLLPGNNVNLWINARPTLKTKHLFFNIIVILNWGIQLQQELLTEHAVTLSKIEWISPEPNGGLPVQKQCCD